MKAPNNRGHQSVTGEFRSRRGLGLSWGRQSWLQAGFQPASPFPEELGTAPCRNASGGRNPRTSARVPALQAGVPAPRPSPVASTRYRRVSGKFLGLRCTRPARHESGENTCELREWLIQCRRRPERPPAGTIACPTRRPTGCHRGRTPKGELRSFWRAEARPTKISTPVCLTKGVAAI
jgi:hypothetical protein